MCAGGMGYADDLKLLCPNIKGLQAMVNTCKEFGVEYDVLYNEKKIVYIWYRPSRADKEMEHFSIKLNGKILKCEKSVKHLGIAMTHNCSDSEDINLKRGEFIGRTNSFLAKYVKLSSEVQSRLFSCYCTHIYGCETWNLHNPGINNIKTSWNIAIRKMWNVPPMAHRYLLPGLSGTWSIEYQIHRKVFKFIKKWNTMTNQWSTSSVPPVKRMRGVLHAETFIR